jgi:hypothetical protein
MKKTIATKGLIILVVILIGAVGIFSITKEVSRYTQAWKEIQFAKNHPMLVEPMRMYYESGVAALDKLTVEETVPTPTPKSSN